MADVVVLGGGVVGCATAYYLAREGAAVVVVEREGVGSQASGFAAGGLFPLQGYGVPGPLSEFSMHAFKMHQELSKPLQEESGVDFQYRMPLRMQLAFGESDIPTLEESARLFKDASGFSSRWLDADEVRRIEPRIAPNVIRGIELKGSAAVDSHLFTNALMRAAEKHGARVASGEVTGVKADGEKITAAIVDGQELSAAQFVVATGPWTVQASKWLNVRLAVDALKGELLRLELPGGPTTHDITHPWGDLYAKPDGLVWAGTTEELRGLDRKPNPIVREDLLTRTAKAIPEAAKARVVMHTACLRPVTSDWLPIVGRVPGWDNVHVATGAGKKGILFSPAMGRATADLVLQAKTDVPVGGFGVERLLN